MDTIITKIIEIEKKAQNVVEEANLNKEALMEETQREVNEMEKQIMSSAEKKTRELLELSKKEAEAKIEAIREETSVKLAEMDRRAEHSIKVWEDEIYLNIVGR